MKRIFIMMLLAISYLLVAGNVQAAIVYDIQTPSGTLTRGQSYDFPVTINTNGEMINQASVYVTYQSQYLQYESYQNGDFFSTVTVTPGSGRIDLTGTAPSAKSGSGTFVTIRFKLIAESAGSTELCTVSPVTTPTPIVTPTPALQCFSACAAGTTCPSGMQCVNVNTGTAGVQDFKCVVRPTGCSPTDQVCWCTNPAPPTPTPVAIKKAGMNVGIIAGAGAVSLITIGLLAILFL